MDANKASATALGTSLMRAVHTRADPLPIIDDPWGDRLVPPIVIEAVRKRALAALPDAPHARAAEPSAAVVEDFLRANVAYTTVITRTRYAEDALHAAVARGATQYVLIGAGFDSYALRTPPQARHLAIYEVDHPATQALKTSRLHESGVELRPSVHFVAADLSVENLGEALSRSPFSRSATTFFSWLGVTMYLSREANVASLRAIAACASPGSELVFTYIDQAAFDGASVADDEAASSLRKTVAAMGEPFVSGFHPQRLAHELAGVGLELLEDLDDRALVGRYDPQDRNGFRPSGRSRIARARVA
jgi:methyltransferase (TIGR00027 family)